MRRSTLRFVTASLLAVVASFVSMTVFADPPGRVARLAEYAGDVRIASSYSDWQVAYRNNVITAGDNLWVSDGGRAELDVGPLQVWLAGGSNIYFERFDDHNLVARLASGIVAVRIREWEPKDAMRIATDHGEVSFARPGLYFVTAGQNGYPSVANARFGQAELNAYGRMQWINGGETFAFDDRGVRYDRYAYAGVSSGGFEGWVTARDRRIDRWEARNRGNHNPWMIGVRDLDDHGYWETSYEYGRVWYPNTVAASWAPYRYGRWTWVQPWGWTWVDDAPWGFAPFHYGRWVRVGGRWAWCPGSYTGRAVYAPALVTFYGGNGWSVSVSTGPTYSWVPLGWNEPFVPWYTYTPNYWRHVNRPYVRNTAEDPWRPPAYVHARVPGAVTTIAAASLVAGRPVAQNYVRNAAEIDLRGAPPARMGEVVPQFRGVRNDPNPVVSAQPPVRGSVPTIGESATRSAPPSSGVFPAPKGRAPIAELQPNRNVAEARVWQDPNPVAPRAVAPSAPSASVVREGAPANLNRGIPERQYIRPEVTPGVRGVEPGNQGVQERAVPPQIRERKNPAPTNEFRGDTAPRQSAPVVTETAPRALPPQQGVAPPPARAAQPVVPVAPVAPVAPVPAPAMAPKPQVREHIQERAPQRQEVRSPAREAKAERREEAAQAVHERAGNPNRGKDKVLRE
jgi:hypothetical protein